MYKFYVGAGTLEDPRTQVGFSYSTMHASRKAQKVADELQKDVQVINSLDQLYTVCKPRLLKGSNS